MRPIEVVPRRHMASVGRLLTVGCGLREAKLLIQQSDQTSYCIALEGRDEHRTGVVYPLLLLSVQCSGACSGMTSCSEHDVTHTRTFNFAVPFLPFLLFLFTFFIFI